MKGDVSHPGDRVGRPGGWEGDVPGLISEEMLAGDLWSEDRTEASAWLARLLVTEGVDLMAAAGSELARGTPVYARADAEVVEVQRAMALNHIRLLPIVKEDEVIGVLDLVELAMRDLDPGMTAAEVASG